MGITLQFVIGDKKQIIDAVENEDLDFFEQLESENKIADFSLHLIPNDLNHLISSVAEFIKSPVIELRENLNFNTYFFDAEDRGACFVSGSIIDLFFNCEKENALQISNAWFDKLNLQYPDEQIDLTTEAINSVEQMINLCKQAKYNNLDLVHVWLV